MGKLTLGPEFARLEELIGARASAIKANEAQLKAEISAHDGSHAYGRHGFQTGWENQLVPATTGITPDQVFDPTGVQGTTRSWSTNDYATVRSIDDHGEVQENVMSLAHYPLAAEFRTGGGDVAGGFYSPEAHRKGLNKANQLLAGLTNDRHYAASWNDTTTGKSGWFPITSFVLAVCASNDSDFYGLGFARRSGSFQLQKRDFVLAMINAYQTGKTGSEAIPQINGAGAMQVYKFNWVALHKNKKLFSSMQELCDYFEVDVVIQKSCTAVFRRSFDYGTKVFGAWRRVTMYPNDAAPGWAPQLPKAFDPVAKQELIAKGMSRETNKYTWNGIVADRLGISKITCTVPPWA